MLYFNRFTVKIEKPSFLIDNSSNSNVSEGAKEESSDQMDNDIGKL